MLDATFTDLFTTLTGMAELMRWLSLALVRSHVPAGRGTEHPAVLPAELGWALVPDPERRLGRVDPPATSRRSGSVLVFQVRAVILPGDESSVVGRERDHRVGEFVEFPHSAIDAVVSGADTRPRRLANPSSLTVDATSSDRDNPVVNARTGPTRSRRR